MIGGVERKIHFFCMDLPHSDAIFVVAYPAETTEAFCDGHVSQVPLEQLWQFYWHRDWQPPSVRPP